MRIYFYTATCKVTAERGAPIWLFEKKALMLYSPGCWPLTIEQSMERFESAKSGEVAGAAGVDIIGVAPTPKMSAIGC